ncbi:MULTISPECIES: L-rhamnose mutarotase [Microbacterium]|uniref:L-rhamnose mutarotase n=1 Tax=Microbacterium TaxID=33882 RepID=UPI00146D0132|nr:MULTISPECIES: L-rhamnose mutarotase [Microbacterium]
MKGRSVTTGSYWTARRTTLRTGMEAEYERIHARIPSALADSLRENGVLSWHIWRDGQFLFHHIETSRPYDTVIDDLESSSSPLPEWEFTMSQLLDPARDSDIRLRSVWRLDENGQSNGVSPHTDPRSGAWRDSTL